VRIAAIAAVLLISAVPASAAAGPAAHVKNTNGWIESIAMDGSRLAYAVQNRTGGCTKVLVWNVVTQGGAVVSGKGTCAADSTSTGAGVTAIAVAGTRLAWIVNLGGNTESSDDLYTAMLPAPREKRIASVRRTGNVDGTLTGGWLSGLVGGGGRIAVNQLTTDASGAVSTAALRHVGTVGLKTIAAGKSTLHAGALDRRRIAVLRTDQTIALYNPESGRLLRTIRPSSAREVALHGDNVVVLTRTRTLEIFNARTGAPVRTVPVAPGAAQLDVNSGIAAYAAGRSVHLLRLSDGKDAVLATVPRAIKGLELEAPGVAYAYNTVKGIRDVGNLAFVPMGKATSVLR
jgi:hypothetical protein